VDYTDALKVPGVVRVFTGEDFPFKVGLYAADRDVLARKKALYYGHPVAAVIAESLEAAEEAATKIQVEYEPLPYSLKVVDSLKPDAPIIHEEMHTYKHAVFIYPKPGTNIAHQTKVRKGNAEEALSKADVVVEKVYREPLLSHYYLEPWTGIARVRSDGTVEVWSSHQSPFAVRELLSKSLNIPMNKLVVHHLYTGGGFGGKAGLLLEHLPILFSKKLGGRPVKLRLTARENFFYMAQRAGYLIKMKTGATKDGKLIAHWGEYYLDAGAYADYTVNMARAMGLTATGPYEIPNIHVDSYAVYTNKVPTTAFRGFTMQELHYAFESQMDELAHKLGMDPAEFRLLNVFKPGVSRTAIGERLKEDAGDPATPIKEVVKMLSEDKGKPEKPWIVRGKGIAAFWKGPFQPSSAASSAIVKVNDDGTVDVLVGTGAMGQGTITALTQIVAEELGIPPEMIRISPHRSTDMVPYTWQTVGSRGLFSEGMSVIMACEDVIEQVKEVASITFDVNKNMVEYSDGKACVKGEPWHCITLKEAALGYMNPKGITVGGPLIGRGYYVPPRNVLTDPETGQVLEEGHLAPFYTFGAGGVEIEINLLTGEIKVLKAVSVYDTPEVNPGLAEGQVIGGTVMGLNIAMRERLIYDEEGKYKDVFPEGMLLNPCLTGYLLARAGDIPEKMEYKFLGVKQKDAPFGAKGIAELTMIPWPAALANAIYNAIGVRITELPITPDKLIEEIRKQRPELLEQAEKYLEVNL
jgi:CO/xanthine dehydrogenase Mo-binding subunit